MLTVARLSTTPIRGFALHHPSAVEIGPHGVIADRRYTMLDENGRIFDGTKMGALVQLRAELSEIPGGEQLTIRFPSDEEISSVVELGLPRQVEIYGRRFTARPVLGPWNEALSAYAGAIRAARRRAGSERGVDRVAGIGG